MDLYGEATAATSIAPPGWSTGTWVPAVASAPPPGPALATPVALTAGQEATEAAMRWRLRAASLDYVIVYLFYLGACGALGWGVFTLGHLIVLGIAVALYHFVLESRDGQTIGKRRYGVRVVALDGGPASPKAVAIRSVLRVVDQLPTCYLSGLVSMVRTGPARRQRIGDVAAETKVIAVDGAAARRGTPGWMLPAATILAVVTSLFWVYAIAQAGAKPLSGADKAQFVAGCERSSGAAEVACQCLLNRLEGDGYVTIQSLHDVVAQAQSELITGQVGSARSELAAAGLACRR